MVSIIVPVFNTETHVLNRCIDSLKKQTYKDIEIIIVDDGSDEIISREYEQLITDNIRLFHQLNRGVSAARNYGTMKASGDFVMYVDSDDFLFPTALEHAIDLAIQQTADMVIGTVYKSDALLPQFPDYFQNYEVLYGVENFSILAEHYLSLSCSSLSNIHGCGRISRGPVARLIRTKIAKQIEFPEGIPIGEDIIWNYRILRSSQIIVLDYNIWYLYLIDTNSAMHRYYGNRDVMATRYLELLISENPALPDQFRNAWTHNLASAFYCILSYDWMSPQCSMNYNEKNRATQRLLEDPIWEPLSRNYMQSSILNRQKLFIFLTKHDLWQIPLKLYKKIKGTKVDLS